MNSNRCSHEGREGPPGSLAALAAVVDDLIAQDLDGLPDAALAEEVLPCGGCWTAWRAAGLKDWPPSTARGAAGADHGTQAPSTASWLRNRLHLAATAASSAVRTARAPVPRPLPKTAQALCDGELSTAHAAVLAHGTHQLPDHTTSEAEPVLVAAARRLDPPQLRRVIGHLLQATDPEGADRQAQRRYERRGLWVATTTEGMVALQGLLDPEGGQTLTAALEPLARPANAQDANAQDARSGDQRRADALVELARRALEAGQLPQTGGVRPQLQVLVELDSLLGHPHALGGEVGGMGPISPEACRRLACDGAVTRVVVTRHHGHDAGPGDHHGPPLEHEPGGAGDLAGWLRAAMDRLPPILGGAPSQPLDVGRTSRVLTPAQRIALAVRDGGCVFPDCQRPLAWCEGHHLLHWLDGGPTDLANLALLCRAHHRALHEGGWQLTRGPDGHLTATPPHPGHPPHRRQRGAA